MRTTTIFASLALGAAAQGGLDAVSGWQLPGAYHDTPQAAQAIAAAGRHRNATSIVNFTRPSANNGASEMWSWRLNITDLPVPNRPSDLGMTSANSSMGLHVLNTQWQINWPTNSSNNNQSLGSFLNTSGNSSIYFNTIRVSLPSNVTSKYPDQSNGSCAPVLGDACTQSLVQAVRKGGIVTLSDLSNCSSTLNVGSPNYKNIVSGFGPTKPVIVPGDTMFFSTTSTYPAGNTTFFDEVEGALHILTMNFRAPGQQTQISQQQSDAAAVVLCQIVNKAAVPSGASGMAQVPQGMLWIAGIVAGMVAMWM